MDACVKSATLSGVDGRLLEVTAVAWPGLPAGTPWRVNAELLRRFMPNGGGWEPIERATSLGLVSDFAAADALRVAWTLADLNGHPRPVRGDCAAALGLRTGEMR